jgi:hypothetical protein
MCSFLIWLNVVVVCSLSRAPDYFILKTKYRRQPFQGLFNVVVMQIKNNPGHILSLNTCPAKRSVTVSFAGAVGGDVRLRSTWIFCPTRFFVWFNSEDDRRRCHVTPFGSAWGATPAPANARTASISLLLWMPCANSLSGRGSSRATRRFTCFTNTSMPPFSRLAE